MQETTFWYSLWATLMICMTITLGMSINHYSKQDKIIAGMLLDGINPVAVQCALNDSMGNNPACIVLATQNSND